MFDLTLAIAHHLVIFGIFGILVAELISVRSEMSHEGVVRIARLDLAYGVLAVVILVVGFTRAIFAEKGWDYYSHNGFFWAKIATFATIGALSVLPTLEFGRWRKDGASPPENEIRRVRSFLHAELVLFALLPIFAAAMARGYGQFG
jgi:putative membrane protein